MALIDFDMAAPGEVIDDLGYMGQLWCLSSKTTRAPIEKQAAQLRILVDSYGLSRGLRRS